MAVLEQVEVSKLRVRRRGRAETRQKPGWQVPSSLAEAVRAAVAEGAAESQNAFVERAILRELAELRRARLYAAYAEAASDPHFCASMADVTSAFEPAVGDGLKD